MRCSIPPSCWWQRRFCRQWVHCCMFQTRPGGGGDPPTEAALPPPSATTHRGARSSGQAAIPAGQGVKQGMGMRPLSSSLASNEGPLPAPSAAAGGAGAAVGAAGAASAAVGGVRVRSTSQLGRKLVNPAGARRGGGFLGSGGGGGQAGAFGQILANGERTRRVPPQQLKGSGRKGFRLSAAAAPGYHQQQHQDVSSPPGGE